MLIPSATVLVTDLANVPVTTVHVQTYDRFNAMCYARAIVTEMYLDAGYSEETAGALAELHVYRCTITTRNVELA